MIGHKETTATYAPPKGRAARFYKWEELCALARGDFKALESNFLRDDTAKAIVRRYCQLCLHPRKIELSIIFEVTKRLRAGIQKPKGAL